MKAFLMRCQQLALDLIRVWWRPVSLIGVAVATWVNLVLIPLVKWEPVDLAKAALWIAAVAAVSWVREWGKVQGTAE